MRRNKKSTAMIANNTFVKHAILLVPIPSLTESNQKVMLSVE